MMLVRSRAVYLVSITLFLLLGSAKSQVASPLFLDIGLSAVSSAVIDSNGNAWISDASFRGPSGILDALAVPTTISGDIPAGASSLFGNHIYGPLLTFNIPVPRANTAYNVTIYTCENKPINVVGSRVFSISLMGAVVQSNIDLIALTGGMWRVKAFQYRVQVGATPTLTVTLTGQVANALVHALSVIPSAPGPSLTPSFTPTLSLTPSNTPTQSLTPSNSPTLSLTPSSTATVTPSTGPTPTLGPTSTSTSTPSPTSTPSNTPTRSLSPSTTSTVTPTLGPTRTLSAATPTVNPSTTWSIFIDCGGNGFNDSSTGIQWLSDRYNTGGTAYAYTRPITGVVDGATAVYQTERSAMSAYTIPVPYTGLYNVTLSFVELYVTAVGARIFSVSIQGVPVISNFDIFATTGGRDRLLQRTFTVSVTNTPSISITSIATVDNAQYSAISAKLVYATGYPPPSPTPFVFAHPGVLVNRQQLDFMKSQVLAGVEPFATAFVKAKASVFGPLAYTIRGPPTNGALECGSNNVPDVGCTAMDYDSGAAFTQALLWYITGNVVYAQNAIRILNAYSSRVVSITGVNALPVSSWTMQKFPPAAEIIRYTYANWSDADFLAFQTMCLTKFLPNMDPSRYNKYSANWAAGSLAGRLFISVLTNNRALFDTTVQTYTTVVPAVFYSFPEDGTAPRTSGLVSDNWYRLTVFNAATTGIGKETCWDMVHGLMVLADVFNFFETAYIQGTDLYTPFRTRMTAALEIHARVFNINPGFTESYLGLTQWPTPPAICQGYVLMGNDMPTFEIGYNAYHNRMGVDLPETLQVLNNYVRRHSLSGRDTVQVHIPMFETLHHGGSPPAPS
eukprot:CAMPEP_0184650136 /NCGR_PEP_ID=MMETSP0308-20130426/7650_1 /TAXON_ID=38269 /ORGANISM="Gloeochaete witrockiana, Strain SAG 46.84" /LENGTH=846 /DNA_ID=CAMNT_0027083453 /DNA_START=310 /DNA_END=2850 /DNA_ORIENTATION=-